MLKHIVLRGAILSDMERRELNLIAGGLIQSFGISIDVNEDTFDVIREKNNYFGYANYYLQNSYDDSKMMMIAVMRSRMVTATLTMMTMIIMMIVLTLVVRRRIKIMIMLKMKNLFLMI